ncbi:MAG: ferredoxin [Actinophytocola sp.]|nr:ferredoxin [Actinophytocola sp.]
MKLSIDPDKCAGHGRCYDVAPRLVGEDDQGYGVVLDPGAPVAPELEGEARRAVTSCPERAVVLE